MKTALKSGVIPIKNFFHHSKEVVYKEQADELLDALHDLLHCPDLNSDELETETRVAIDKAATAIHKAINQTIKP